MKTYPRQSKNVFELTAAQNASLAKAGPDGKPAPQPQMAGEQRTNDQRMQATVKQMDDAMRRENVRRKNPFIQAQLDAIDKMASESQASKYGAMFPKSKRLPKKTPTGKNGRDPDRTRWNEN